MDIKGFLSAQETNYIHLKYHHIRAPFHSMRTGFWLQYISRSDKHLFTTWTLGYIRDA